MVMFSLFPLYQTLSTLPAKIALTKSKVAEDLISPPPDNRACYYGCGSTSVTSQASTALTIGYGLTAAPPFG